jgi:PAS domain S-box-containing protein
LGLTKDQMESRTSTDPRWRAIHPDGSPFLGETHPVAVALETGQPQNNIIMGVHKPDDSLTWISINTKPIAQESQTRARTVIASFTDVTRLIETTSKAESIMNTVGDAILTINEEGIINSCNPAGYRLFGYPPSELVGRNISILMPEPYATEHTSYIKQYLTTQNAKIIGKSRKLTGLRKDGTPFPLELRVNEVDHLGESLFVGVIRDLTQHELMQKELVSNHRLRATGELAAGVSHNLNNILTGIIGPAQLLAQDLTDPMLRDDVNSIVKSGLRARELVKRLFRAVSGSELKVEDVSILQVLRDAIHASRPKWQDEPQAKDKSIIIKTEQLTDVSVLATDADLHDIFLNLIINATDALPQGGEISFSTKIETNRVCIQCSDTGIGMTKDTKKRIFDPFFSTKAGVGAGLGLATVYRTVQNWGGHIDVNTAPNEGCSIQIWLPLSKHQTRTKETKEPGVLSNLDIIIVDDEPNILLFLKRILSPNNKVVVFDNANDAINQFQPGQYQLLITDLGMPNMNGQTLIKSIQAQDKKIKTVLMTGWEITQDILNGPEEIFFLQKPFTQEELETLLKNAF